MTADKIMRLVAEYTRNPYFLLPDGGPGVLALQLAIQRVVEERDEALKALDEAREARVFSENEMQDAIIERDEAQQEARAECHGIGESERYTLKASIRRAVDERDQAQEDFARLTRMRARSAMDRYDF